MELELEWLEKEWAIEPMAFSEWAAPLVHSRSGSEGAWSVAPQSTTGIAPSELLMGRPPSSHPFGFHRKVQHRQDLQKEHCDSPAKPRSRTAAWGFCLCPELQIWSKVLMEQVQLNDGCIFRRHLDHLKSLADSETLVKTQHIPGGILVPATMGTSVSDAVMVATQSKDCHQIHHQLAPLILPFTLHQMNNQFPLKPPSRPVISHQETTRQIHCWSMLSGERCD